MHPLRWHYGLACCAAPTLVLGTAALAQAPAASQAPLEEIVVTATMIERTLDARRRRSAWSARTTFSSRASSSRSTKR